MYDIIVIGGGAAGLATAIDIQNENAQIRARNAAFSDNLRTATVSTSIELMNQISATEKYVKEYTQQIEAIKMKLVDERSPQELLELLNPKATVRITSTGAASITVTTSSTNNFFIYDTVPAVIDGTIKVKLLHEGAEVGSAYATLPFDGSKYACKIKTICTSPKIKAQSYNIEFEPHCLWAIEQ